MCWRGAQGIDDVCVQNRLFGSQAQLHRELCVVLLVRVLDLLEGAWGNAAGARLDSSGACLLTLLPDFVFDLISVSGEVGSFLIRLRPVT